MEINFFLTTPFDPAINDNIGGEYLTLFIFDSDGNLIDSTIESFGPRGNFDEDQRTKRYQEMLDGLGEVELCRIEVKLFSVEKYGLQFGLITRVPE